MRRLNGLSILLISAAVALLAACNTLSSSPGEEFPPNNTTPGPYVSQTALVNTANITRSNALVQAQNITPTPTSGTSESLVVRIWWPDDLYPAEGSVAENLLFDQIDSFTQTYASYELELRRKRPSGLGGILPTLRTAETVAPGILPHLTLMRRADMLTAANEGLIYPLDGWAPSDVMEGLFPGTRAMGEIEGVLYGVPYVLSFRHVAYRPSDFPEPLLTFADVLEQQPAYRCPAGTAQGMGVNWTFLLQYLEAGGRLTDETGQPVLDREPLLSVLKYYEQGVSLGIFDPEMLAFSQYDAYWNEFVSASANMICTDSLTYLNLQDSTQGVEVAALPTLDGAPMTDLNGWMWVLTTQVPDAQTQARAFLQWMMRVSQQSRFTEALGVVPASERALRLWDNTDYAQFAERMIASGIIVSNAARTSNTGLAMQDALIAVLEGETALTAVELVDSSPPG